MALPDQIFYVGYHYFESLYFSTLVCSDSILTSALATLIFLRGSNPSLQHRAAIDMDGRTLWWCFSLLEGLGLHSSMFLTSSSNALHGACMRSEHGLAQSQSEGFLWAFPVYRGFRVDITNRYMSFRWGLI